MLKKLVLLVVALFSIATEMRMMVQFGRKTESSYHHGSDSSNRMGGGFSKDDLMKWSELWHAQSVFFGAYYLPSSCPLVSHVANSYNKHYILNKKPSH
jgi:hypothetical protein